ncbi:MAG: protein kinase domain-containing protein, partial [Solirubrobacterales bacterium]
MSAPRAPQAGDVLGGCRLEREAASGGMGVVWEATQIALGRRVAVKVIAPALAGDPEFRERFVREARLTASVHHPNIVDVYDAGEQDGVLYIVMRFVDGVDLRTVLREQAPLESQRAVRICEQVAGALDAAHRAGLIHRDVTPSNVLLSAGGTDEQAALTDFGLVKHLDTEGHTKTGAWFGTLAYVAPEALRDEPVTGAADTYSLGCVLYRMLTGEVPFSRGSDAAVIAAHLSDDPPKASLKAPVSPAMDAAIEQALAKDPGARQGSAGELARQAREALSGRAAVPAAAPGTDPTPPAGEKTRVAPVPAADAPTRSQSPGAGRRSGRLGTVLVAGLAALMGAVGAIAIDRAAGGQASERKTQAIPRTPAPVDLVGYSNAGYRAAVPRGWRLVEDAVPKGTYTDSEWRAPAPARASLKIAYRPDTGASPEEVAGNLRTERAGDPSYAEIAGGPIGLN